MYLALPKFTHHTTITNVSLTAVDVSDPSDGNLSRLEGNDTRKGTIVTTFDSSLTLIDR